MGVKKPTRGAQVDVAKIEGDVDRSSIEACEWMLSKRGPDLRHVVLDLSEATSMDLRGGPLLVSRRRVLKARGGELAVAAGLREVRDVIRASTGAELQVFPTVAEAMAWVKGEPPAGAALVRPGPRRTRVIE